MIVNSTSSPAVISTITLAGANVVAPVMSFLASTNPTPNIAVGGTGTPFPALLVGNDGGRLLSFNGLTISGANPADFVLTHVPIKAFDCPVPGLLQMSSTPGGFACQVGIAFRPSALGARSATLTLTTNDPAQPVVTVQLAGNGVVAPPPPPPAPAPERVLRHRPVVEPVGAGVEREHRPPQAARRERPRHRCRDRHLEHVRRQPRADLVDADLGQLDHRADLHWRAAPDHRLLLRQPNSAGQAVASVVGTATLTFSDANNATLAYTVGGVTSSRAISRKPF